MDTFEKQQRIGIINGIIKVRWFIGTIIIGLGLVLKTRYFGGGWGAGWGADILSAYLKIGIFGAVAFGYNFIFWLIMHRLSGRPLEKVSEKTLNLMSVMQIVPDQIAFTVLYYFNGTVDTMAFMFYFLSLFFAGSLYKTRGIVATGAMAGFLYTLVSVIEYKGLVPHLPTYSSATFFGDLYILRGKIFSFLCYIGITTFTAAFLSNLIKNRENKLRQQGDQLLKQTQLLGLQTHELIQAKGELQSALAKSDVARKAAVQARDETEKANTELNKKINELEKFYNVTVGREVRMAELKQRVKELEEKNKKTKK